MKNQKKYESVVIMAAEEVAVEELAMILAQIYIHSITKKTHERIEKISDQVQR